MKMKFFTLANIAAMSMCLMACNNTTTSTNDQNNNTKELESTSTEVSSADQTVSDTSTNNTTVSSDTNLDNSTHDKMIKTYQDALNQVINNNILSNGTQLNADGCINPITDNYFSIYDIDNDGLDELIINFIYSDSNQLKIHSVFGYDDKTNELHNELQDYVGITYLNNNEPYVTWENDADTASDELWPYTVYEYNSINDVYDVKYQISAHKVGETVDFLGNKIDPLADTDNAGVVFLVVDKKNNTSTTLSKSAYQTFYNELFADSVDEITIPYMQMTEDNINSLK